MCPLKRNKKSKIEKLLEGTRGGTNPIEY